MFTSFGIFTSFLLDRVRTSIAVIQNLAPCNRAHPGLPEKGQCLAWHKENQKAG